MSKVYTPLIAFGGKSMLSGWILRHFPPHNTYVEVFGLSAAVLLRKEPSSVEIYNDVDGQVVNFFRVLRDNGDELIRLLNLTPYSVDEYYRCLGMLEQGICKSDLEMAYVYFIANRMSFSGNVGAGWKRCVTESSRGYASSVSKWLSAVERLPEFVVRLKEVQIENEDFRYILEHYDTPETLFYLDPPYYGIDAYKFSMSVEDHVDLVNVLLDEVTGMTVLSGYANPVYDRLLEQNWMRVDKNCTVMASLHKGSERGKKDKRVESLWLSPQVAEWVAEKELS